MIMSVLQSNQNGLLQHILANQVTIHFPALPARRANIRTPILISYPVLEAEGAICWSVDLYLAVFTPLFQSLLSYSCALHFMTAPVRDAVWVMLITCEVYTYCLQDGSMFKAQLEFSPYMYVQVKVSLPSHNLHVASQKFWSLKVTCERCFFAPPLPIFNLHHQHIEFMTDRQGLLANADVHWSCLMQIVTCLVALPRFLLLGVMEYCNDEYAVTAIITAKMRHTG